MQMLFGKYAGCSIEDVPTGYLRWLLTISLLPDLQFAVENELANRRRGTKSEPPQKRLTTADLDGWYRRLSLRYHPDHGGSKAQMQVVHAAKDLLDEMLK